MDAGGRPELVARGRNGDSFSHQLNRSLSNHLLSSTFDFDADATPSSPAIDSGSGEEPRSSSLFLAGTTYASSSSRSSTSMHSASAGDTISTRANKVLLPINEHGIRTRVNILPAKSLNQRVSTLSTNKSRPTSLQTIASIDGKGDSDYADRRDLATKDPRRQSNLSMFDSQSRISHNVNDILSKTRRNVSESAITTLHQRMTSPDALDSGNRSVSDSRASAYIFPGRPDVRKNENLSHNNAFIRSFTLAHHQYSSFTSENEQHQQVMPQSITPHGQDHSNSSPSSSSVLDSSYLDSTSTSIYTTPSSSKVSPNFVASHDSINIFSKTTRKYIPKTLIPGGYDSPSGSSIGTRHTFLPPVPDQSPLKLYGKYDNLGRYYIDSEEDDAEGHMRDRSASVPRTVSDIDEDSSGKTEDEVFQQPLGVVPSGSTPLEPTLTSGQVYPYPDSAARLNRSIEQDHFAPSQLQKASTVPPISRIPPKLDIDFGSQSLLSLDLDFGRPFDAVNFSTLKGPFDYGFDSKHPKFGHHDMTLPLASHRDRIQEKSPELPSGKSIVLAKLDLGLGWGFPPASRLSNGPRTSPLSDDSKVQSKLYSSLSPDFIATPKASISLSGLAIEKFPLVSQTEAKSESSCVKPESVPADEATALIATHSDNVQAKPSPETLFHKILHENDHDDISLSPIIGSGRLSGFARDRLSSPRVDTTHGYRDTSSEATTSSMRDKRSREVPSSKLPASTHNPIRATSLSLNKSLPPVPPQGDTNVQLVASISKPLFRSWKDRVPSAQLLSNSNDSNVSMADMQPSEHQNGQNGFAKKIPHRTRSDSTNSTTIKTSVKTLHPLEYLNSLPKVLKRSRSNTVDSQSSNLPFAAVESEGIRGHHGSSSARLDIIDPGVLETKPSHAKLSSKASPSLANAELTRRDSATDKLLVNHVSSFEDRSIISSLYFVT